MDIKTIFSMKDYDFKHLITGWDDPEFETKVKELSNKMGSDGWKYYDIKISSKDNHCLVIFAKDK